MDLSVLDDAFIPLEDTIAAEVYRRAKAVERSEFLRKESEELLEAMARKMRSLGLPRLSDMGLDPNYEGRRARFRLTESDVGMDLEMEAYEGRFSAWLNDVETGETWRSVHTDRPDELREDNFQERLTDFLSDLCSSGKELLVRHARKSTSEKYLYEIHVTMPPFSKPHDAHPADKETLMLDQPYEFWAPDEETALNMFHDEIPIKVLDDYVITAAKVEKQEPLLPMSTYVLIPKLLPLVREPLPWVKEGQPYFVHATGPTHLEEQIHNELHPCFLDKYEFVTRLASAAEIQKSGPPLEHLNPDWISGGRAAFVSNEPRNLWEDDLVQFARLIAECEAAGVFNTENATELAESMDLTTAQLFDLVTRAEDRFDKMKEELCPKKRKNG